MRQFFLTFFALPPLLFPQSGALTGINASSDFLVYYGNWTPELVAKAEPFDLVILDASNLTPQLIQDLKDGADDTPGTEDDVIVLCYVSLGEVAQGNLTGNGLGPCQFEGGVVSYDSAGYASWYLDDADNNNLPDQNGIWGSYYVNAGDTLWWQYLRSMPRGIDYIMNVLQCDGLFFDTIDTASPWTPYSWTVEGMSDLIAAIRNWYPAAILMANRGLFYFDPALTAYNFNIRPYINAILFEAYYTEWDWQQSVGQISPYFNNNKQYWAPRINAEANKPDGFSVFVLDYLNPAQNNYQTLLQNQMNEVIQNQGWVDAISSIYLDQLRYDVYHNHVPDQNYPTWPKGIGVGSVLVNGQSVLIRWDAAFDQTPPLKYNIYLSESLPFDFSQALRYANVAYSNSPSQFDYEFLLTNLPASQNYYLAVRAEDSATPSANEDQNNQYLNFNTAADPATIRIQVDGDFTDWEAVPRLDFPPNLFENSGDGPSLDTDLLDVWYWADSANIYFRYKVLRYVSLSSNFYRILIDSDRDAATGFHWDNSQAGFDFMVENENVYEYSGQNNSWSWNFLAAANFANSPSEVELAIPYSLPSLDPSSWQIQVVFQADNNSAFPGDLAPDDYQQNAYLLQNVITGVTSSPPEKIPSRSALLNCYPNPFNGEIVIELTVPNLVPRGRVFLYNLLGQQIALLYSGAFQPGRNSLRFQNAAFSQLSSGLYVVQANLNTTILNQKILYLK